jgi:hypothetical protein
MICSKRNHEVIDSEWKSGETYEGLDRHHNPPEFMFKRGEQKWFGEMLSLCRKHHVEIHREIKQILFRHSSLIKFVNSEDWLCKHITDLKFNLARIEIYNFTKRWLNDTKST